MNKSPWMPNELYAYLARMRSHASDPLLAELRAEAEKLGDVRDMISTEEQGDFFQLLAGVLNVQSALEIGTFIGFSSLCLARGMGPQGRLLCLDVNEEWTAIARRYWARAGVDRKIELRLGPAQESLKRLEAGRMFDFVFIDADKPAYDAYYELVLPRVRQNGLILFDNMLARGRILKPESERDLAIDALNRKLAADPRVESVLLPIADGITFCRKK